MNDTITVDTLIAQQDSTVMIPSSNKTEMESPYTEILDIVFPIGLVLIWYVLNGIKNGIQGKTPGMSWNVRDFFRAFRNFPIDAAIVALTHQVVCAQEGLNAFKILFVIFVFAVFAFCCIVLNWIGMKYNKEKSFTKFIHVGTILLQYFLLYILLTKCIIF